MEAADLNTSELNGKSIIYVTSEEYDSNKSEWSREATKFLLKFYDEKMDLVETGIIGTQKKMWEVVAKEMHEHNFYYSPSQCENKWKSLKRAYRTKLEKAHNNKSYKRVCPFEKEVCEILAKRNGVSSSDSPEVYTVEVEQSSSCTNFFDINLNEPPGPSDVSDEEDTKNFKVHLMRNRQDSLNQLQTKEAGVTLRPSLTDEILKLKREIRNQNVSNVLLQQKSIDVQDKIAKYLEVLQENFDQSYKLESRKVKQQDEVIEQMKLQNALLQKLLERL